jgi:hypothetical protein
MSQSWTHEQLVRHYQAHAEGIADDHMYETDTIEALLTRSHLQWIWGALGPILQRQVLLIDEKLLEQQPRIAEVLEMLVREREPDRAHWWWYLDRGPQVREEAERMATPSP